MMASNYLMSITLVMLALVTCLVSTADARQCTFECEWEDEELTLCDDRFVHIFSGKVVRVFGNEQKGFTDYDVEVTEVFRGEGTNMYIGTVVTLRTKHTTKICPVRDMAEGQNLYFAVGAVDPEKNYRIFADTCNSYIKLPHEFTGKVLANLLNGDFRAPCDS